MADLATKDGWCAAWGLTGADADAAWAAKQAFVPCRLPSLIIGDIQPYQAMGTDIATGSAPRITSRSQHREYLRRNNYTEIGNETMSPKVNDEISNSDIARQVKQSIDQKRIRL